ncbi:MAG: transposase, partial [Xanthomarina gelatinilytica]|uniref:ISL3 family transposase n=1 Tax=Xanthomarina gelatinilytica TaxID=1137281 RepID=UPI003A870CFA
SKIQPFIKVSNTIKAHWTGIVNYIESKINNGILEGINSKIQLAKKRTRGYRNTSNFINMIYFICGKLKFEYPLYLT